MFPPQKGNYELPAINGFVVEFSTTEILIRQFSFQLLDGRI